MLIFLIIIKIFGQAGEPAFPWPAGEIKSQPVNKLTRGGGNLAIRQVLSLGPKLEF